MDVLVLELSLSGLPQEVVEQLHRQEVRPLATLEGCCDFDKPVNHLGAIFRGN